MILDTGLAGFDFPADSPQLHAGIIPKVAMLIYDMLQIPLQLSQDFQAASLVLQHRSLHFQLFEEFLDFPHGVHGGEDIQKLRGIQHCSQANLLDALPDILDASHRWMGHRGNIYRLGSLPQAILYILHLADRLQSLCQLLAQFGSCLFPQLGQYSLIF